MDEIHLDPEQLAQRERVPLSTVYQWNSKGTGPRRIRVGKHIRYRLDDVVAWENAHVIESEAG